MMQFSDALRIRFLFADSSWASASIPLWSLSYLGSNRDEDVYQGDVNDGVVVEVVKMIKIGKGLTIMIRIASIILMI